MRRVTSTFTMALFLAYILMLRIDVQPVIGETTQFYIPVPHHYQSRDYYCGPAALEMIFDYYGSDINQFEIADVARTDENYGTGLDDMRRAAHFSNLSTRAQYYKGYSERKLGYATFEKFGITIEELKTLIAADYPIIVATSYSEAYPYGHYRVVVGFNEMYITFHDPWGEPPYCGPNVNVTYSVFLDLWEQCSNCWGLFVTPWNVSLSVPNSVVKDDRFNVTAVITYSCPAPFSTCEFPASLVNATITLSEGLELVPNETRKKQIETDYLYAGDAVMVNWTLKANTPGDHVISVEAEGKITGSVDYTYEDRIGGSSKTTVYVKTDSTTIVVPNDYPSIQEAINNAEEGDTIYVRSGTYYENVVVNKTISLVGEDRDTTIIDGNYSGTVVTVCVDNVTVTGLTIRNSELGVASPFSGVYAYGVEGFDIGCNTVTNNDCGIHFGGSSNGTVHGNKISNNYRFGVFISYPAHIEFYHNNFINNEKQATDYTSDNSWDNGCEGNYWSDYIGTDNDGDGIGDIPYVIDENNQDNYPLMNLYWNPADVNHDLKVDIYDVVLACNAYGSTPLDPNWNCHCDIAEPYGVIDIYDVVLLCAKYGSEWNS